MAYDGLQWSTMNIGFRSGLMQKADDRARPSVFLDIAKDVAFDELGGIQSRFPFLAMSNAIFGGGTLANCRRLAVVNDELCVFTDTALYSWNAQLTKWVLRATHLAVNIDEQPACTTTDDQIDSDRAELNGTVVYSWSINVAGGLVASYVEAKDKATGSVLMTPTLVPNVFRTRLVALATKILFFATDLSNGMGVIAIDPASPATSLAGGFTSITAAANLYYDVVRAGTQDLCVGAFRRSPTTSYTAFTVTPALVITSSTKARVCDGPIAVATGADGTQTQIVRANGTNIQGDLLTTSTLADVFTAQAIGTAASTTINQVTASFSAANIIRAFWTSGNIGENSSFTDFEVKSNTVTSGTPGTQATFRHRLGIASRAFTYAGRVYVWLVFAQDSGASVLANVSTVRAQLQNTYFLYRDDNFVVSQCTKNVAGGFAVNTGRLPGVALTSGATGFSWCGTSRRRIDVGTGDNHTAFGARSPRDITFTFDSDAARRCARIGRTMYITGGIPLQYDGVQTAEVGFLNYPWYFEPAVGGVGLMAAGAYTWKATYGWNNAQGEIDRSTTATGTTLTIAALKFVFLNVVFLNTTLKVGARRPSIDMWRTTLVTAGEQPFYKVTSQDPTALPGANNGFVLNDDTLESPGVPLPDNFTDVVLTTKEQSAENGIAFEYTAPPGAGLILETDTRIYLGKVSGDPDRVWPSRLRNDGEVASWHEDLSVQVPRPGGAMTALAIHNETLTVFRETAVYRLPGEGFSNTRQGTNFVAFEIPGGVGAVNQESVASTPLGTIFKSLKGWYLLTPGWSVQYIGAAVSDYDTESVLAATVLDKQHQVRIVTSARVLMWNYSAATEESPLGQWGEWTVSTAIHALMWQGQYAILTPTGPAIPRTTFTGGDFGMDVETAWIKLADLQGAAACRKVQPLGEIRSLDFMLWIRVAYNYKQTGGVPDYVDSKVWTPTPAVVGGPLQLKHGTKRVKVESIKVRLTAVAEGARATLLTTALAPQVPTSGTVWAATWRAAAAFPGELGNSITMSVACVAPGSDALLLPQFLPFTFGGNPAIRVLDHFAWSQTDSMWVPDINNIGVVVAGPVTVAELESAIAAASALATVSVADPTPTKTLAMVVGTTSVASFSGGVFIGPPGEALKLTGLGLEVGLERQGVYNRFPASQST